MKNTVTAIFLISGLAGVAAQAQVSLSGSSTSGEAGSASFSVVPAPDGSYSVGTMDVGWNLGIAMGCPGVFEICARRPISPLCRKTPWSVPQPTRSI